MGYLADLWAKVNETAAERAGEEEAIGNAPPGSRVRRENERRRKETLRRRLLDLKPSGPYTAAERVLLEETDPGA